MKKPRALIVEDDFISRRILNKFLEQHFDCDIAVNGIEAVSAFKLAQEDNLPYRLILMDVMMPHMDGHEAIAKIRSQESGDKVTVIFTTAVSSDESIAKAFDKGKASAYIAKPINKDILLQKVREAGLID